MALSDAHGGEFLSITARVIATSTPESMRGRANDEDVGRWHCALGTGMTFQMPDVQITSRHVRRMARPHSVAAFLLNVLISDAC